MPSSAMGPIFCFDLSDTVDVCHLRNREFFAKCLGCYAGSGGLTRFVYGSCDNVGNDVANL